MPDEPKEKRFPWKRILAVLITGGALYGVFRKVDARALGHAFKTMHVGWFVLGVLGFGTALLLASWRWHLMLRLTGAGVHLLASVRLYLIGQAMGFVLLGPALGDVAKSVLYSIWHRLPLPQVIAAAPLDRILGLIGLVVFSSLALGLAAAKGVLARGGTVEFHVPAPLLAAGAVAGAAGLWAIFFYRPRSEGRLARAYNSFAAGATQLMSSPRLAWPGLTLGFMVQALSCFIFALCLKAVAQQNYPWMAMLWTFPVISAMNAIPSVSGLGVREAASITLLSLYKVPAEEAVAASLLVTGIHLCWTFIGGAIWLREDRGFERRQGTKAAVISDPTISVVIPVFNEAVELPETLRRARAVPGVVEVIVCDGGSTDGSVQAAEAHGCRVLACGRGRGRQMRAGAASATGDVVLLLHADTWLPPEAGPALVNCLRDSSVVVGGFWKVFRDGPAWLRGSRFRCAVRWLAGGRVLGDQAIFARREVLEAAGGVPDLPLMEEFELCRRLRQHGRLALADAIVLTSARRFTRLGVVRTYLRMWKVLILYWMGRSPEQLRAIYEAE
jgi:rSAM/selenodomain-associated transferase 2